MRPSRAQRRAGAGVVYRERDVCGVPESARMCPAAAARHGRSKRKRTHIFLERRIYYYIIMYIYKHHHVDTNDIDTGCKEKIATNSRQEILAHFIHVIYCLLCIIVTFAKYEHFYSKSNFIAQT